MKKLTPSKFLSSMALATLVAVAGTQTAQAADFKDIAPNGNKVGAAEHKNGPTTVTGDIQINGNFNKTVTSIPTPEQAGSFLIVTMPLNLDYTYNANTGVLTGAQGVIENKSVKVTAGSAGNFTSVGQPIEMQIISLTQGNHTTDKEVMFVDNYDPAQTDKIQVPLQLTLTSPSATAQNYKFVDLVNPNTTVANAFFIAENTNVNIEIGEIPGKSVGNANLITKDTSVASHALKLQFEYKGQ